MCASGCFFFFLIVISFSKPAYFWQSIAIYFCRWLALIFILELIWTVVVALRNDSQHLFPLTPNPFLNCTLPFLNYRRFHHVHMQGCVGGWRGCHYTGKMLSIWKNFAFIWGLLFVSLSSPKCPCVQALPLLNSYYYLALEGHANCLITWRVMKQLGHQHIIQVWVPKGK